MNSLLISALSYVIEGVITFFLGVLLRKQTAHALIKARKWLSNEVVTINFLAVRTYPADRLKPLNSFVYDDAKARIPSLKLNDVFDDELIVTLPTFGKVRVKIENIPEENETEIGENVNISVVPESPLRLGIKEWKKLYGFENDVESLLDSVEKFVFPNQAHLQQSYAVCSFPRVSRFVEERNFDIEDVELGATIQGRNNKLAITASPASRIAEATQKYKYS